MEQSSGRMKQADDMLDVRENKSLKKKCVVVSFDAVKIQDLMRNLHAE